MKTVDMNTATDSLLKERFGAKDPFTVPDGYFEGLTAQVMAALPPQKEGVKRVALRRRMITRWVAAASVACVVALGGYLLHDGWQSSIEQEVGEMAFSDDEIDETLDYLMVNNSDITSYLTMGE